MLVWCSHGFAMMFIWVHVVFVWFPMVVLWLWYYFIWCSCVVPMVFYEFMCFFYVVQWFCYEFDMITCGVLMISYGFDIISIWLHVVFLWHSYCVAMILFYHFAINIGMSIGFSPVIGIPLPFFSYGGSSIISFSIRSK